MNLDMGRIIEAPRGRPNLPNMQLSMIRIDLAESRLSEVKTLNIGVAADLKSVFNDAMSDLTKYIATMRYEYMQAKQNMELAKAEALLDKYPDYVKTSLKESGMKDNSDIRDAFIAKDPQYREWQSILNHLEALTALLEAKNKTIERAYWDCRSNIDDMIKIKSITNYNASSNSVSISESAVAVGVSKF